MYLSYNHYILSIITSILQIFIRFGGSMSTLDTGLKHCAYAGCKQSVPSKHYLCTEHYEDLQNDLIDQCPKCGRFKIIDFKYCSDCRFGRVVKTPNLPPQPKITKNAIVIEHSKSWEKGDKEIAKFFVYILRLDNGKFYFGHSNDLRSRLSEHRDGEHPTTKGLNPKLKYFEIMPTRDSAAQREAELKLIFDKNPRQIRRMLIDFSDLVSELED